MGERLTLLKLLAIEEALMSRLAGERDNDGDPEAPTTEEYDSAWNWASEQIRKRRARAMR